MATFVVPFYGYFNKKIKGMINLAKFGKRKGLHFSMHDEVGTNVLGLDVSKRALIYVSGVSTISSYVHVDLRNVIACSINKQYQGIEAGELKSKKLQDFLKSVFLNFRFKNSNAIFSIPFYDAKKDNVRSANILEAKARKWERMVSDLMPAQILLSA